MNVTEAEIPGLLLIKSQVFSDKRGWFEEIWQAERYEKNGIPDRFVQDNQSYSQRDVMRGLHMQNPYGQGKLVRVIMGEVFDVAVDVRRKSPWFGKWAGANLSGENRHQFYIPEGFAHGYLVLSDGALLSYKCTDYYHPETQFSIRWDDPQLGIEWPFEGEPLLSEKDREAPLLSDIPENRLPLLSS